MRVVEIPHTDGVNSVNVQYFAFLRERRGITEEIVNTTATTLQELYEELACRYDLRLEPRLVRYAIHDAFVPADTQVREGMVVALIPPVAGG